LTLTKKLYASYFWKGGHTSQLTSLATLLLELVHHTLLPSHTSNGKATNCQKKTVKQPESGFQTNLTFIRHRLFFVLERLKRKRMLTKLFLVVRWALYLLNI
jgi:hypothetical protein